jgi:hypothetical protein
MAIHVDTTAVRKASNIRSEDSDKFESPIKELGSRVTARQVQAVAAVLTPAQLKKLLSDSDGLTEFAETGELARVNQDVVDVLNEVKKAAREYVVQMDGVTNGASHARRIWPRKIAAIVMHHDATTPQPEPEPESDDGKDEKSEPASNKKAA